jgi:hypothetical protein
MPWQVGLAWQIIDLCAMAFCALLAGWLWSLFDTHLLKTYINSYMSLQFAVWIEYYKESVPR